MSTTEGPGSTYLASLGPEWDTFFTELASQICWESHSDMPADPAQFAHFFHDLERVMIKTEAKQMAFDAIHASQFNLFHWMNPNENKLSDIFADLLHPLGSHGQGSIFLELLFRQLGIEPQEHSLRQVCVQREAPTHGIIKYRRRMDILIRSDAIIAIENKIDSAEQIDQVKDYLNHLLALSRNGTIPHTLIYLTPNGRAPDSLTVLEREGMQSAGRLHCWSYRKELRNWLEACRTQCQAVRVRYFLDDLIRYLETNFMMQSVPDEEDEQ